MSLRNHLLEAWANWEGKATTKEDRDIAQILHYIEDWDDALSVRLTDFMNTDGGELSVTTNAFPADIGWRLMESLPKTPRGSSFSVKNNNKMGQRMLCPTATLILSTNDKQFFDEFVPEGWDTWVEEFKVGAEAVLGRKLAWTVEYRGKG